MKTITQLLEEKGNDVWSIGPGQTVFEAIERMADKGIGALVVMDGDKTVGVVSERDYARKVILKGRSSRDTLIKDIMSTEVVYASPEQSVDECLSVMTNQHIRHLPVKGEQGLIGMLSIGDLVKEIIAEQKNIIQQLEQYISG